MKLEIADISFIYELLENPPHRLEGEEWKDTGSSRELSGFQFNPISLPEPLQRAGLMIKRHGNFYSASVWVEPKERGVFAGLSGNLERKINSSGEEWFPTSENGTGYILKDKKPILSIMGSGENFTDRLLSIGVAGAYPKKFNSQNFSNGLTFLTEKAGLFIDVALPNEIKDKAKDLTFYFSF